MLVVKQTTSYTQEHNSIALRRLPKKKKVEFKTKVIYDNAKVLDNDESLECVKCFIDLSEDTHKKVFGY